ncbi:MAG: membrane dipeptidase [Acidobacteria bacterium]|nr:membrane dipeptidase [Acidobacteriota bacterium]
MIKVPPTRYVELCCRQTTLISRSNDEPDIEPWSRSGKENGALSAIGRNIKYIGALLVTLCVLACAPQQPPQPVQAPDLSPEELHHQSLVIDTHADTLQRVLISGVDIGQRLDSGHIDFLRMREGGLDAEFFAAWVDSHYTGPFATKRALQLIDAFYESVEGHPDQVEPALNAADIERLHKEGKVAALLGIEGGHAIDGDLRLLRVFHRLGVRYMTLTWSNTNAFADSSGDQARWNGLNELGEQVVREMNRIGMIVDISHVSDETFWDTLRITTKPVIASHSSARALQNVPRNMTDEMLKAVAKNGGVVGINFYSAFLSADYARRSSEAGRSWESVESLMKNFGGDLDRVAAERYRLFEKPSTLEPPPFELLIDHIDHVVKVAGVDHVGLGSDFDGVESLPAGIRDVRDLPKITSALLSRGYSPGDVTKILGGNFLRVLRMVTGG